MILKLDLFTSIPLRIDESKRNSLSLQVLSLQELRDSTMFDYFDWQIFSAFVEENLILVSYYKYEFRILAEVF